MSKKVGRAIKTRISPDMLDTIGKSFRFKHGKGIAEWLKNSLDQYLRQLRNGEESLAGGWPVYINLVDGKNQTKGPNLAVLDFGGTGYQEIDKFFLYWGDTSAASHGKRMKDVALTGGHGNGGKFYMREMWREGARFLTWRNGKSSSLVVIKMHNGDTGYWESEDEIIGWQDALRKAVAIEDSLGGIGEIINHLRANHPSVFAELEAQKRGFSIVVGRRAVQSMSSNDVVVGGKWKYQQLIDEICDAQQARRPIREMNISVSINGTVSIERLTPHSIEVDPDWPSMRFTLPSSLVKTLSEAVVDVGWLTVVKSANQLVGRLKDLNSVYVFDANGNPVASYPLHELSVPGFSPILSFMHAEIHLTIPEISQIVTNDRERLVESPAAHSVLQYAAHEIWERVKAIEKVNRANKAREDLEIAAKLNETLNKHAQRFLQQVQTEILVDYVQDPKGGGPGSGGSGAGGLGKSSKGKSKRQNGRGGNRGAGGDVENIGNTKSARRSQFPRMLLSGLDVDPSSDTQETKNLTDRHPPLHQDDVDRTQNVWWINTTHPFAEKTLNKGGPQGYAFKNHHLSMFRDMVQREALRILQRREAELPLDRIEVELDEVSNRFLAELPWDIVESLLE